jgi:hypothetical protein
MKKLFFAAVLMAAVFVQAVYAQEGRSLSPVLNDYFGVKDALVAGDARAAAGKAAEMMKAVSSVNVKTLPGKDQKAFTAVQEKLVFDARHISESSDLGHQREHFAVLSTNMALLAKQVPMSQQPVYEDYCPMKKAYWLSSESAIKNPYYGNSMLTCGKVTATLKP